MFNTGMMLTKLEVCAKQLGMKLEDSAFHDLVTEILTEEVNKRARTIVLSIFETTSFLDLVQLLTVPHGTPPQEETTQPEIIEKVADAPKQRRKSSNLRAK